MFLWVVYIIMFVIVNVWQSKNKKLKKIYDLRQFISIPVASLREHVIVDFKNLANKNCRICCIMSTVINGRISSNHNLLVISHHSDSATEQTIVTHSVSEAMVTDRPLVWNNKGRFIPLTHLIVILVSGSMASAVV